MEELKKVLASLLSEKLYQIIISNPRQKAGAFKIKVRPVMVKEHVVFQQTVYEGTKVFHDNLDRQTALDKIARYMEQNFRQLEGESTELKITALVSKKGKITIKAIRKKAEKGEFVQGILPDLSHNRVKKYILEEGKPVPFLVDLGVQTKDGRVVHARYDKFRQINRYLEFVEDVLPVFEKEESIHIIDFGCGKSYLTFALYYYLHELKKREVTITGLDLKEDVIDHCNTLAEKYGYDKLCFLKGDIAKFEGTEKVDMVVTLHACDTATDYALKKAIDWDARVIFSVPCCQHEVNKQIENELFSPVFKYGLIRERMSALLTDAVRANLLEEQGYDTQILEFIDMEHTPKNILIRAVKNKECGETGIQEITDFFHVNTTLQKLLNEKE
ncbi:MAG: SAM-dependent methyltransferase [Lachnospiraceae bacterium]|nr:SAM-dependent methyltransferase [Lachnospiraceae bacterium]